MHGPKIKKLVDVYGAGIVIPFEELIKYGLPPCSTKHSGWWTATKLGGMSAKSVGYTTKFLQKSGGVVFVPIGEHQSETPKTVPSVAKPSAPTPMSKVIADTVEGMKPLVSSDPTLAANFPKKQKVEFAMGQRVRVAESEFKGFLGSIIRDDEREGIFIKKISPLECLVKLAGLFVIAKQSSLHLVTT